MAGTAVVQSGNYELEIDTGFLQDAFTLDSATMGLLDGTQFVLDGTTNFATVLDGCGNVTIKRGRQDIGDQFSAGTMAFVQCWTQLVCSIHSTRIRHIGMRQLNSLV
jgi:hypothetical protein